jgi:hypothetical protein
VASHVLANARMRFAVNAQWSWFAIMVGCGTPSTSTSFPPGGDDAGVGPPLVSNSPLDLGPTVTQPIAPPPISGGTLTVLANGTTAVAADPDRDRVYVVDVPSRTKLADIALASGDEPGRVIEDGAGRIHVVLRGGGAIVAIDPATWTIADRRGVCPAPRGIAWDAATDLVHVACAGGELVSLPAAGGAATRSLVLDRDLRDVVVLSGTLIVSRFRTAQLLVLDANGAIAQRVVPPSLPPATPDGAWRIAVAADGLYMVHQRAGVPVGSASMVVTTDPGGYGELPPPGGVDPCKEDAIVETTVTYFGADPTTFAAAVPGPKLPGAVVPVDLALAHGDDRVLVVSAGNANVPLTPTVVVAHEHGGGDCDGSPQQNSDDHHEASAVAFAGDDTVLIQLREPARLVIGTSGAYVDLSSDSRRDTGHAAFHGNTGAGIACASCHLEGGDDGHVWTFDTGPRRTQTLRGGVFGTEPFHWNGDQVDFAHLLNEVFVKRMSGPILRSDQLAAMKAWVGAMPLIAKAPGDPAAIARGQAVFQDPSVGCATCHSGPKLTNNMTVNVGTGRPFQVPSLRGVIERPPFLHDGRAATLADRFDPTIGGGDLHGRTSELSSAQVADLIAYLSSL